MTDTVPSRITYLLDEKIELDEKSVAKVLQKDGKKAKTAILEAAKVLEDCAWTVEAIEAALRGLLEKLDAKPRFRLPAHPRCGHGQHGEPAAVRVESSCSTARSCSTGLAKAAQVAVD